IFIRDRLFPPRKVNDGKPGHAQCNRPVDQEPNVIGTSVALDAHHGLQFGQRRRSTEIENSCYPAHCWLNSDEISCDTARNCHLTIQRIGSFTLPLRTNTGACCSMPNSGRHHPAASVTFTPSEIGRASCRE